MPSLIVTVSDGKSALYDAASVAARPVEPGLASTTVVKVGGRNWTLESRAAAGFTTATDHFMGFGLALVGIALSFILFVLTRGQVAARHAAEKLAGELSLRNRELDEFAYVASHDLKAPLRGIANLARWIEEDTEGELPKKRRRASRVLQGRVVRLERPDRRHSRVLTLRRAAHRREIVDCDTMVRETYARSIRLPRHRSASRSPPPAQHQPGRRSRGLSQLAGERLKHAGPDARSRSPRRSSRTAGRCGSRTTARESPRVPRKVFGCSRRCSARLD